MKVSALLSASRTWRVTLRVLLACCAFLCPSAAEAQANYDGLILGGRTAMMGGAAVAKGSDGATAFINPAGLIRIPGQSFSFSTVAVQAASRQVNGRLDPSGALGLPDGPTNEFSVRILPNTFCLFLDGPPKDDYSGRSRHKYGVCVANTESQDFTFASNLRGQAVGAYDSSLAGSTQMRFNRTSVAFAWGFDLFPGTHIGVTARADRSEFTDQTTSSMVARFGGTTDMQSMIHSRFSSSFDSSITVGMTQEISRVVTLGMSLATPTLHLLGSHTGSNVLSPANGGTRTISQDSGDFRYNQPSTLRLGLAFAWPSLNFEVNGNFYAAQQILAQAKFVRTLATGRGGTVVDQTERAEALIENSKPIVNLAAGMEAFIEPDFSIVGGVQTDFSGLEDRRAGSADRTLFRQRMDAIHGSLGVASYGAAGSLLLGLRGTYGLGEILIPNASGPVATFQPFSQSEWALSFVMSGQISFESVRDTAIRAAQPLMRSRDGDQDEEQEARDSQKPAAEQP